MLKFVAVSVIAIAAAARGAFIDVPSDYPTIQQAVNAAAPGDFILIEAGTWFESVVVSGKSVRLSPAAGGPVIIDGGGAPALTLDGDSGTASSLTGITFRNGSDNGSVIVNNTGATFTACTFRNPAGPGCRVDASASPLIPAFTDCRFEDCAGPGLHIRSASRAVAIDCVFTECEVGARAGVDTVLFAIYGCEFLANVGAGLESRADTTTLEGSTFESNGAEGARCEEALLVAAVNCTFRANGADGFYASAAGAGAGTLDCIAEDNAGAGVRILADAEVFSTIARANLDGGIVIETTAPGPVEVLDCLIEDNHAMQGGGLLVNAPAVELRRCRILTNAATNGAGIHITGALTAIACEFGDNHATGHGGAAHLSGGTALLGSCALLGNTAGLGGAGIFALDQLTIRNATIVGNFNDSSTEGAGILLDAGAATDIRNSILWANGPVGANATRAQLSTTAATIDAEVRSCCIEGGWGGAGGNNFNADPGFVSGPACRDAFGNLRLMPDSPCLDAGNNAFVSPDLTEDLAGCPRIHAGVVNIGAYENTFLYAFPGAIAGIEDLAFIADECNPVIIAAPGLYTETVTFPADREIAVVGSDGAGATTIDAGGTGRVFDIPGGSSVTIRGFTLTGGSLPTGDGAALRVAAAARADVIECTLQNHTAQRGGAIDIQGGLAHLLLVNATGNSATDAGDGGGALRIAAAGEAHVFDSTFTGNNATFRGGIYALDGATLRLEDSLLELNTATSGAGVRLHDDASATLRGVTLRHNDATGSGGALLCAASSTLTAIDTLIELNTAPTAAGVGASLDSDADLLRCRLLRNDATTEGGAIVVASGANLRVVNSLITSNTAADGAAAHVSDAGLAIINSTLLSNQSAAGPLLTLTGTATLDLWNSILRTVGELSITGGATGADVRHSNVLGGFLGAGNIDAPPLLVDPDGADGIRGTIDDDMRLRWPSACRNTGDASLLPPLVMVDLLGGPRVTDGLIDMGAHEFLCEGDTNADGLVDFNDLNNVLDAWGQAVAPGAGGDVDFDGLVTFADLEIVLDLWGADCSLP